MSNTKKIATTNNTKKVAVVDTKAVKTTKKAVTAKKEVTANAKKNDILTITDVDSLYQEFGIEYGHKGGKLPSGNYRIMKDGSSLNLTKRGIAIYSTQDDAEKVRDAKIDGVTVAEDNKTDHVRPWSVKFANNIELARKVLALYGKAAVPAVK